LPAGRYGRDSTRPGHRVCARRDHSSGRWVRNPTDTAAGRAV